MIDLIFLMLDFAFVVMAIKMADGSAAAFGAIYLGGVRREMSFLSNCRLALCVAALSLAAGLGACAESGPAGLGAGCRRGLDRAGLVPGEALSARAGWAQILRRALLL